MYENEADDDLIGLASYIALGRLTRARKLSELVDHTKSYLMRKKLRGAYPGGSANLREGAYQNLDSKGGANPGKGADLRYLMVCF